MSRSEVIKFLILRTLGNFLLLFSIIGIVLTFGQAIYQEALYRANNLRGVRYVIVDESSPSQVAKESEFGKLLEKREQPSAFQALLDENTVQPLIAKDIDFSILIPKIGASAKVLPNVNAAEEQEYLRALQQGVAHAAGTVFPGMNGNIFLFAHSADNFWDIARFNATFYLLKELEPGDEVVVIFQGKRYNYEVFDKKLAEPHEVGYLDSKEGAGEILTLQTCWPPGTPLKRMLIFAKRKVQ